MMHSPLLFFHSILRWLLLLMLVYAIYSALKSWLGKAKFSKQDEILRKYIAMLAHIQFLIGLWLYLISPEISYFWGNFKTAIHVKAIRFFAMEHSVMMVIAIVVITMGSILTKRMKTEGWKIKLQLVWVVVALLLIFVSIPWPFFSMSMPRPYFRWF